MSPPLSQQEAASPAVAVPYRGPIAGEGQDAAARSAVAGFYRGPMAGEGQDETARCVRAGLSKVRSTDYFVQVVPGPDWVGPVPLNRVVGETIAPEAPHIKEWVEAMLTGSHGGKEIYPHVWDGGGWWDRTAVV